MKFVMYAQVVDMNRTFNVSDPVTMLFETETLSKENAQIMPKGSTWHLENNVVGDDNFVKFWIDKGDGQKSYYHYWNGGVKLQYKKTDKGQIYYVYDKDFKHLTITKLSGMWIVQLCTILIKKDN